MSEKIIDITKIIQYLPHRYPFLLVDRIVDFTPMESAIAIKNVTFNEPHFTGHFPDHPVMPGVLIIEAMAQTSAVLVVESCGFKPGEKMVYFMSIDKAKFRKPVVPGDRLELHVKTIKNRGSVWVFAAEGKVDGSLVAEAEFSAMIFDKKS